MMIKNWKSLSNIASATVLTSVCLVLPTFIAWFPKQKREFSSGREGAHYGSGQKHHVAALCITDVYSL